MTPRSRATLAVVSALNLLHNLLFPVLAVRALGAGAAADALFMVFILPGVVMVLLGNSVLNWVTPRLVHRPDHASRRVLCWSLLWTLLGGIALLCVVLWLGAQAARGSVASGGGYALAIGVLPLGLLAMLATVVSALGQSLYTAERDVLGSESRTLVANVLVVVAWFAFMPATLAGCAALFALRVLLGACVLLPRLGPPQRPAFADADLRDILRESRVLLLAATYYKSEPFVDRLLFATAPGGAVAAFHVAQQLSQVATLLMNRTITAPLLAPLAERIHAGDVPGANRLLDAALQRMLLCGLVIWALFIFAGESLVRALFSGSGHDPAHAALTGHMLALLGGFTLAVLLGQVLALVYYCAGETRLVVVTGVLFYTLGLVLKIAGLHWFGVTGLVAATSITWLINVGVFGFLSPGIFRRVAARAGVGRSS